jgi:hypothetical protein
LLTPPTRGSLGLGLNGGDTVVHGLVGIHGALERFPDPIELGAGYAVERYSQEAGATTLHGAYAEVGYRIVDALPHRVVASLRGELLGLERPEPGAALRLSYGNTVFIEREHSWDNNDGASGIFGDLGWAVYVDARAGSARFDGSHWTLTAGLSVKLPIAYMICCIPH